MKKKYYIYIIVSIILLLMIGGIVMSIKSLPSKPYYEIVDNTSLVKKYKKEKKEDVLGWIKIQGTNIDLPIIDIKNANKYTIDYQYGWSRYMTNKLKDRNVIYGHNILNVSKNPLINDPDHGRFEPLMGFVYDDYAAKNKYIEYSTDKENYLFKIYSISFVKVGSVTEKDFINKAEKKEYIKKAIEDSLYKYKVSVNENDKLLTIYTCTRMFGADSGYEFKVEARLVRDNEKIDNYKMKVTKEYDDILDIMKEGAESEEAI